MEIRYFKNNEGKLFIYQEGFEENFESLIEITKEEFQELSKEKFRRVTISNYDHRSRFMSNQDSESLTLGKPLY